MKLLIKLFSASFTCVVKSDPQSTDVRRLTESMLKFALTSSALNDISTALFKSCKSASAQIKQDILTQLYSFCFDENSNRSDLNPAMQLTKIQVCGEMAMMLIDKGDLTAA